ncbi:MAG: TolC family protein [Candidatus Eremiobacteraeota bacterium]|nr:TolC family protein [Candidatus Eremiobacteraeota bacterium]
MNNSAVPFRISKILLLCLLWGNAAWAQEEDFTPSTVLRWVGQSHPRITAAELKREGARSYFQGAGKQPNPQLKISLSRGVVQEDANALTQTLEIAGQPALRKKIASSLYSQADQETVLVSREIAQEALGAYYQVWMARRTLEIAAVNHHLALELEAIAERRFSEGQISQDEARQAHLLQTSALAALQKSSSAALAAEASFRALVDLPQEQRLCLPGGRIPPRLDQVSLPQKEEIAARVDLLPEVEIARTRALQAKLEADLAGKAGAPDLYLYAYRSNFYQVANQGVQFGISFPLFDWGELGAEHSRKKLMAESLQAEAEASRRSLKAKLFEAIELCQGQIMYVETLEQQFKEREILAHHSLIAYELGLVSLLEAVDTQKSYQSSLLELAQEAVALETQRVNLHLTFKETL